jgi:hypothetical protein
MGLATLGDVVDVAAEAPAVVAFDEVADGVAATVDVVVDLVLLDPPHPETTIATSATAAAARLATCVATAPP